MTCMNMFAMYFILPIVGLYEHLLEDSWSQIKKHESTVHRILHHRQGHLYVPVRPRPANKLCPLNFSISTSINFHLKNQKKKKVYKIFHLSVCYQKRFAKSLFSTNFASPKAVAHQGHGLIGLRHKVAQIIGASRMTMVNLRIYAIHMMLYAYRNIG